jgi:hypothetical protein
MRRDILINVYQSHIAQVCGACSYNLRLIDAVDDKVYMRAAPFSRMATPVDMQISEKLLLLERG